MTSTGAVIAALLATSAGALAQAPQALPTVFAPSELDYRTEGRRGSDNVEDRRPGGSDYDSSRDGPNPKGGGTQYGGGR